MPLDDLEGGNTRHNYKGRDGESLVKIFKYRKPFGLYFKYYHQVEDHNNRLHSDVSLDSTWYSKFWPYCNFTWYLSVMEVNTVLASGHFQNGGDIIPTLDFWW